MICSPQLDDHGDLQFRLLGPYDLLGNLVRIDHSIPRISRNRDEYSDESFREQLQHTGYSGPNRELKSAE